MPAPLRLTVHQAAAGYTFAAFALGAVLWFAAVSPPAPLPGYGAVVAASDSAAVVRAAVDALRGASGVSVPMRVTRYVRQGDAVVVALQPVVTQGIIPQKLGGTVRVLADGGRVVLARY